MHIESLNTDEAILSEMGRRLARARLDRNLSQKQLAAQAGVGKATLERLEAGLPSKLPTLIRVLRALDLLEGLDELVPAHAGPSPVDLAKRGRERRRAAPARSGPRTPEGRPWGDAPGRRPWGDGR
jgi:transcriptional regulator with XRE-family HTH domain